MANRTILIPTYMQVSYQPEFHKAVVAGGKNVSEKKRKRAKRKVWKRKINFRRKNFGNLEEWDPDPQMKKVRISNKKLKKISNLLSLAYGAKAN